MRWFASMLCYYGVLLQGSSSTQGFLSTMKWLENLRTRYTLSHHPISHVKWQTLLHKTPIFHHLSSVEKAHLREITTLFLNRKTINGVQGLPVSTEMTLAIAVQACLPILKLGLDYYDGWVEIVLYPGAFRVSRKNSDENGLIVDETKVLSGESWSRGPVILSWEDIESDLSGKHPGHNVVIHEFTHKLDMLNGSTNGMPPLHSNMSREHWTAVFSDAFEHFQHHVTHHRSDINPYAATSPAEFFAVMSEYFFAAPQILTRNYPLVYKQLALYYRQNPRSFAANGD